MDELKALLTQRYQAMRRVCVMLQHEAHANWRRGADNHHPHWPRCSQSMQREFAIVHQQLAASEYRAVREALGVME